jgi:hypothetical protein
MLEFLDIFFLVFHSTLILFNVFGWIWKKTKKANLVVLLLTGGSWFILGIFYGWGYCPLTDWHWRILYELGEMNLPNSYIQYLVHRLTGLNVSADLADRTTLLVYFAALMLSLLFNFKHRFRTS